MKRKIYAVMMVLLMLLISCETEKSSINGIGDKTSQMSNKRDLENDNTQQANDLDMLDLNKLVKDIQNSNRIETIHTIKDNALLIISRKEKSLDEMVFTFIDINESKVLAEWSNNSVQRPFEIYNYEDEIIIYDSASCIYSIDYNFNIKYVIDMNTNEQLGTYGTERNYCILPKQKKVVFYKSVIDENGFNCILFACDYDGNNEEEILKLEQSEKNVGLLNGFKSIIASYDETCIYFVGFFMNTFRAGEEGKDCFGVIRLNDKSIQVEKSKVQQCWELFQKGIIFFNGSQEFEEDLSMEIIYFLGNERRTFFLAEKHDSEFVTVSEDGLYLYCYQRMEYIDNKTALTKVNVYSLANEGLESSFQIPFYIQKAAMFPNSKKCILIYSRYADEEERNKMEIEIINLD